VGNGHQVVFQTPFVINVGLDITLRGAPDVTAYMAGCGPHLLVKSGVPFVQRVLDRDIQVATTNTFQRRRARLVKLVRPGHGHWVGIQTPFARPVRPVGMEAKMV
tara:strand:- start:62 stop:376 length:315 start_codon:yes stop_codon:yes gene_type:complete